MMVKKASGPAQALGRRVRQALKHEPLSRYLPTRLPFLSLALLVGVGVGCKAHQAAAPPPKTQAPERRAPSSDRPYSTEDAAQELGFSNAPAQRIHSRRRSVQHKSMPLHGAQAQPCAFEDCDISDEDDPL